ncbi:MAG: 30S ribosomal protein S16 [Candidatus Liptonbacteria bacterium]|nr:30S ribosomal protein S16 [Candidatus Liptonbacteria bacterium]
MLAIKLKRVGKKHQPSYRIMVAERRSKATGVGVEDLGHYNPFSKSFAVQKERVQYWLSKGAQPTQTLHNLFLKHGVTTGQKIAVKMKKARAKEKPSA